MRRSGLNSEDLEEVRVRLAQRPADAVFTAAEAAIYTGRSTRTLKRAIDAGVGPKREKNPDVSGLGATNRHTRYRKGDLDAWREGLMGFATSFNTFADLALDAPWLTSEQGIAGHLLDIDSVEAVVDVLADDRVVFLRLDEVLEEVWSDQSLRRTYLVQFLTCVESVVARLNAIEARNSLDAQTAEVAKPGRPPRI